MRELNKQEQSPSDDMPYQSYFDHPSLDLMERFVLQRSSEHETELIEAHMFACESCASVRENLELEIKAMKLALEKSMAEEASRTELDTPGFWTKWFSLPVLSFAAAGVAACALCLFAVVPANVELKAERGAGSIAVPEWRNSHLTLRDGALQAGPLTAEVVNQTGSAMWTGTVNASPGQVVLTLPRLTRAGHYYARLYTPGREHELLSEFPFEVKFQF